MVIILSRKATLATTAYPGSLLAWKTSHIAEDPNVAIRIVHHKSREIPGKGDQERSQTGPLLSQADPTQEIISDCNVIMATIVAVLLIPAA